MEQFMTVTTWANGFGTWHARVDLSVPVSSDSPEVLRKHTLKRAASVAREAITDEINQRQVDYFEPEVIFLVGEGEGSGETQFTFSEM